MPAETQKQRYDALIAHGLEPEVAGSTYEWSCSICGERTWTSAVGGVLDWDCTCDHDITGTDGHGITIHCLLAGVRRAVGTTATIEGRKPGEPSARKRHRETCDGTCEGCRWHDKLVAGVRASLRTQ